MRTYLHIFLKIMHLKSWHSYLHVHLKLNCSIQTTSWLLRYRKRGKKKLTNCRITTCYQIEGREAVWILWVPLELRLRAWKVWSGTHSMRGSSSSILPVLHIKAFSTGLQGCFQGLSSQRALGNHALDFEAAHHSAIASWIAHRYWIWWLVVSASVT